ncbi:MAG: lysophospholipid acyltransferase family protein [Planctomycetes bacterium]|nr:lysophospholipid acyltransferase family protein [Planctomycetota bacterium]
MPERGFWGELKYRVAGSLGGFFIRMLALTFDGELENPDAANDVRRSGRPVIYAFWHGSLVIPIYTHRGSGIGILISRSADGEYVARIAVKLGFHAIRGSSTRGGEEGFRLMRECLVSGRDIAITPDGPTGPKHEVKKGLVYLARASGAVIVPAGLGIDRYKEFDSWDGFRLPLPGAYILARFGEPIEVPERVNKFEMEDIRLDVEKALNALTADCQSRVKEARRTKHRRTRCQGEPPA